MVAAERAAGRHLDVWLTLPVSTSGLTAEGLEVLKQILDAGVEPACVNAMVMDCGVPMAPGVTMGDQAEHALTALQVQLRDVYAAVGRPLSDDEAWQRIGATPMIGQNDVLVEVFDLDDAQQLDFARHHHLRQLFMWSANRDQGCGPNYPEVQVVSDQCSGVTQSAGGFADILGGFRRSEGPLGSDPLGDRPDDGPDDRPDDRPDSGGIGRGRGDGRSGHVAVPDLERRAGLHR